MTTRTMTYIVCDHCGVSQPLSADPNPAAHGDGRAHHASDLPCSHCGSVGATSSVEAEGPETLRRIAEREDGIGA
jgi:hypothetical protein